MRPGAAAELLKRDRVIVATALIALTVLAWIYLAWLSAHMVMPAAVPTPDVRSTGEAMTGMDMGAGGSAEGTMTGMDAGGIGAAIAPALRAWTSTDFAVVFAMWSVMMIGMMTPSVAPMVLLYAGVGRKAADSGTPIAPTGWFLAGYLAIWTAFSVLATFAQWALTSLALLTPMMAAQSATFGGVLLIGIGLYQWSPLKDTCLRTCQAPLGFLMAHGGFRTEPFGALSLGMIHGAYCLGCCFALMALLFVGGIMNLLWIAGLTILILLEKVVPTGRLISRISGAAMFAAGIWLLVRTG